MNTPYAFNQAVLGWNGKASMSNGARVAQELWSRLGQGMTIAAAREDMMQEALADIANGQDPWLVIGQCEECECGNFEPVDDVSDMPILGDHYTRIKAVYTGNNDLAPGGWYL